MSKQYTEQLLHIATPRFREKGPSFTQSSGLYGDHVAAPFSAAQFSLPKRISLWFFLKKGKPVDVVNDFQQTNWEYGMQVPCCLWAVEKGGQEFSDFWRNYFLSTFLFSCSPESEKNYFVCKKEWEQAIIYSWGINIYPSSSEPITVFLLFFY